MLNVDVDFCVFFGERVSRSRGVGESREEE
jgi:hypothetical protein